jgi:hypothetical protein
MRSIAEAITQKEYDISMSDEPYKVVFGFTYIGSNKVISAEDVRYMSHTWLIHDSDQANEIEKMGGAKKTWRYVPLTETIYWWDTPNGVEQQATLDHLKSKYGYSVDRNVFVDAEMDRAKATPKQKAKLDTMLTTAHNPEDHKFFGGDIPTFKQWYYAHVGD